MKKFLAKVTEKAQENPQWIVFPEGTEERILKATAEVQKLKTAQPVLIGNPNQIKEKAESLGLTLDYNTLEIHDPLTSEKTKDYAEKFFVLRQHKGCTEEEALETMKKINYFGTMMVYNDEADGLVSGTTYSTADTVRPALQIIKTKDEFHKVSGVFIMILENRLLFFADTAIMIEPNAQELAEIAADTAETAKRFGIEPRVAMLSFSTAGSAKHPDVEKMQEATKLAKEKCPGIVIEGEMQVDAALVPEVCTRKFPNSNLKGDANVLIFPSLEAGNIAYKLVERLAKAKAIGPILQGLRKPVNDLSRGCSWQDIVHLTALTTCEAQDMHYQDALPFIEE